MKTRYGMLTWMLALGCLLRANAQVASTQQEKTEEDRLLESVKAQRQVLADNATVIWENHLPCQLKES